MARMKVVIYPDPVLRETCSPVQEFGPEVAKLAEDMAETMYAFGGIGLAAPQIGVARRVIVVDYGSAEQRGKYLLKLVNPEILESDGTIEYDEGCLSLPGIHVLMTRKNWVKVRAQTVTGEEIELEKEGLPAVVLQHEIDHLNGVLILDSLSPLKRRMAVRDLKRLKEHSVQETQ